MRERPFEMRIARFRRKGPLMAEKTAGVSGGGARDTFTGKTAFVISCIGSAVGLSGIWLFPYRVSEMGGAAYLIP